MIPDCIHCANDRSISGPRKRVVNFGHFTRRCDGAKIQRFLCRSCGKSFSMATLHACFRQKKRELNPIIFQDLVCGISQRRIALRLRINRKTVIRKFLFLGRYAVAFLPAVNANYPKTTEMQFDDLETFEHSKLKPLSATIAVEFRSRRILGVRISRMPAKGHLVQSSLKKYGPRKDERKKARDELFTELKDRIEVGATIRSDKNPHYPASVRKHFPGSKHETSKGRRGCVVGQGELKAGGKDPLFSLNHTYAMFRANVNRLYRKTWNTTKIPERLGYHMCMYALYHNLILLPAAERNKKT